MAYQNLNRGIFDDSRNRRPTGETRVGGMAAHLKTLNSGFRRKASFDIFGPSFFLGLFPGR